MGIRVSSERRIVSQFLPHLELSDDSDSFNEINMEKLYKIIIIGDPTVGKTAFTNRYVNDVFHRDYKGTIGGMYSS